MPDCNLMEVDYEKYCKICVDRNTDETKNPCNECLAYPYNEQSSKPVYYKEDTKEVKKRKDS